MMGYRTAQELQDQREHYLRCRAERDREINENLRREWECGICVEMRDRLNNRLARLRTERDVLIASANDVQGQIQRAEAEHADALRLLQGNWVRLRDECMRTEAQIKVLEEMAAEPGEGDGSTEG